MLPLLALLGPMLGAAGGAAATAVPAAAGAAGATSLLGAGTAAGTAATTAATAAPAMTSLLGTGLPGAGTGVDDAIGGMAGGTNPGDEDFIKKLQSQELAKGGQMQTAAGAQQSNAAGSAPNMQHYSDNLSSLLLPVQPRMERGAYQPDTNKYLKSLLGA